MSAFAEISTPAVLVDRRVVRANIERMARLARHAGVSLRPHFKTSKSLEVARMQLEAGAIGLTCATPAEVEALIGAGVERLLWAHQAADAAKVALAVRANREAEVIVAVDSVAIAEALDREARRQDARVPIVIEVDTGLGRAGVAPQDATALARLLRPFEGLELRGVMTHEGHVARWIGSRDAIERGGTNAATQLVGVSEGLRAAGFDAPIVSVGATPAATSSPFVLGVTEARPGTYVYNDANQVELGSASWEDCAVTVLARVVSRPRPGVVVIDAGLKAMSSDASNVGAGFGRIVGIPGLQFVTAFEEHGVLEGAEAEQLHVGDTVRVVPNHVCGAINMWHELQVVEGDETHGSMYTVGRH